MSYLTSVDLEMYSGDHLTIQVTVIDTETGLAKNLTGLFGARWKVSKNKNAPANISKLLLSGITLVDGPTGRVDIDLLPIDTALLRGEFIHELELTDSISRIQTVMDGTLVINQDLVV